MSWRLLHNTANSFGVRVPISTDPTPPQTVYSPSNIKVFGLIEGGVPNWVLGVMMRDSLRVIGV
jgi:hypothetical protein